jgi:hypothetical protein
VAGWLAQGGSGFGSYEYGQFKENVVSARVVLPTGEAREFDGEELATYIADAEGITGIITEVTFKVRPLEPEVHRLIAFTDAAKLGAALQDISKNQLPIWSITFLNPESTRLKKQLPHRHGHPWEMTHEHSEPVLPEAYLAVIAYPASRASAIEAPLAEIAAKHGGTDLGPEAAEHEWEQRTAPMRLKRMGPSIVPTEVIVPLAEMSTVLGEIDRKIKQPFILEGMVGKGDKVVLLGFIPHDERSLAFNLAFALSLSVIKIAKAHGGAAYSTGLYFRREAESVLGAERVQALKAYKAKVDPKGLLNPGKVLGSGLIDLIMGAAGAMEPSCGRSRTPQSPRRAPATSPRTSTAFPVTSRSWRTRVLGAATACRPASSTAGAAGRASRPAASTPTSARSSRAARSGTARPSTPCWSAPPARSATPDASCSFLLSTTGCRCAASSSTRRSAARSRRSR